MRKLAHNTKKFLGAFVNLQYIIRISRRKK